jgi:hypothetical protein
MVTRLKRQPIEFGEKKMVTRLKRQPIEFGEYLYQLYF